MTAVSRGSLVLSLLLPFPLLSLFPHIFLWPEFLTCQTFHLVPLPNKIERLPEKQKSHWCANNRLHLIFRWKVVPFLCHASCPRNHTFIFVCPIQLSQIDSLSPPRAESVLLYGVRIPVVHLRHSLLVHRAHCWVYVVCINPRISILFQSAHLLCKLLKVWRFSA